MMCSPKELGLAEEADGLLILREDAKVGQPFAEYLGRAAGDVVYDLEITPNRPDLNSVIGIAREIAAVTGNPLRLPEIALSSPASAPLAADLVAVRLDDPDLCPRYTARVVTGVKIGPSPDWLRSTLEKDRHPQHQQRGGCDELRDDGSRATAARVRLIICWRRPAGAMNPGHRCAPRRREREIRHAGWPGTHADRKTC